MIGLPYNTVALSKWCLTLTSVCLLGDAIFVAMNTWLIWYIQQTEAGILTGIRGDNLGDTYDAISAMLTNGFVLVALAVVVVNAVWIYRSSANAAAIDPNDTRITPGWAVGWFAVPVANFWLPYVALRQTMNTSFGNANGMNAPLPAKYMLWWGAWILSELLAYSAINNTLETSQQIITTTNIDSVGSILAIIAGLFFLTIIRDVTAAQKDRANFKAAIFE